MTKEVKEKFFKNKTSSIPYKQESLQRRHPLSM